MYLLYIILLLNIYSSKTNLLGEKAIICFIKRFSHLEISICVYCIHLQSKLLEIMGCQLFLSYPEKTSKLGNQEYYVQDQRGPSTLISPSQDHFSKAPLPFFINKVHSLFKDLQGIYLSVGGIKNTMTKGKL